MQTKKNTSGSPVTWLFVLLTTLSFSINIASATAPHNSSELTHPANDQEISNLLAFAKIDADIKVERINVKIYDLNDELIYSAEVCHNEYNGDDRLNQLINQSDFITEIDNTKIYILDQ